MHVSRFSRLCLQTRFIRKKNKQIDVKSVKSDVKSDKVAGLPDFHTFSGADIKGSFFSEGKKKFCNFSKGNKILINFSKENKVLIKHLRLLVQP